MTWFINKSGMFEGEDGFEWEHVNSRYLMWTCRRCKTCFSVSLRQQTLDCIIWCPICGSTDIVPGARMDDNGLSK